MGLQSEPDIQSSKYYKSVIDRMEKSVNYFYFHITSIIDSINKKLKF